MNTIESPESVWNEEEWLSLSRDPRYWTLWSESQDKARVVGAGFIKEPKIFKASTQKMPELPAGILLLITGCFAPIHEGHLGAMRQAKEAMEKETGKPVVGGFFGFCHDAYVNEKTSDYPLEKRLTALQESSKDDWMFPFLWESEQDAQTNFTSVLSALQDAYPTHQVSLVYGSDNASFGWTSKEGEIYVCVAREGLREERIAAKGKILNVEGLHPEHSSTKIRKHQ